MPRSARGRKELLISPSQEEALEEIAGWDDAQRAPGIFDETPSQPGYLENSSQNSGDRVFDVTGSSLCSGASQEGVEWVSTDLSSPRTTSDAPVREEDSYNEAFESDRSQSPSRTLSWNLAAANRAYSNDPKSPVSTPVVAEEAEKPPEVESSKNLSVPPGADDTSDISTDPAVGRAPRADGDAEDSSGRRERVAICEAAVGGAPLATADVEGDPAVGRSNGVRAEPPWESPSVREIPALKPSLLGDGCGSGSAAACMSQGRNENDFERPFSGDRASTSGIERGPCVLSVANAAVQDSLDQIANSVQVNMQVLDDMVVDDGSFLEEKKSGPSCKRRRCNVQHELDNSEKVGEGGSRLEVVFTTSTAMRDELENPNAGVHLPAAQIVEISSGEEKSKECLVSPTPSNFLTDVAMGCVDKPGATVTSEDPGQQSPSIPRRPSRAVQEKLDKLRSQSGNKTHSESCNLQKDRLRTERDNVSTRSVLEAIKRRSGPRPVGQITGRDLLKTALEVGIKLPPPFHKNYFS